MKKIISIVAFLVFSTMLFAQEGVNFRDLTYEEALEAAKAEKKMLFVDCYTSWCGPCKRMAKVVFTQKEAGDFFNSRFVCVKYDMEQGEGIELEKKWDVRAYPTFLLIRPTGEVQHTILGERPLSNFIEKVKEGLKEKTSFIYLDECYKKGKISKKQKLAYFVLLQETYHRSEADAVKKELMAEFSDKEKVKAACWPLFSETSFGSADFDYVIANWAKFQKNVDPKELDEFLNNKYSRAFAQCLGVVKKENIENVKKIKEQLGRLDSESKPILLSTCDRVEATLEGDVAKFIELSEKSMDSWIEKDFNLMERAFDHLQDKATKSQLKQMMELAIRATTLVKERSKKSWEVIAERCNSMSHVGVYFENLTLEEALEKAKKMRKRVLVDCYTSWCGPCKMMLNKVFPEEKVGDFMNAKFINVKYNMEEGAGPELGKKYGVKAYPTFLILNTDGTVYHKIVGGALADEFLEILKKGLHPANAFGNLEKLYQDGNREERFLKKYLQALIDSYDIQQSVVEELLALLTDEKKMSDEYWFIFKNSILVPDNSDRMKFLIENREQFRKNVGAEEVNERLSGYIKRQMSSILQGAVNANSAKKLKQIEGELSRLDLDNKYGVWTNLRLAKAIVTKSQNKILTACEKELEQLAPEKFLYSNLFGRYIKTATPAQKKRWIQLGKELKEKVQDAYYKKVLEKMLIEGESKK